MTYPTQFKVGDTVKHLPSGKVITLDDINPSYKPVAEGGDEIWASGHSGAHYFDIDDPWDVEPSTAKLPTLQQVTEYLRHVVHDDYDGIRIHESEIDGETVHLYGTTDDGLDFEFSIVPTTPREQEA